MAAYRPAPAREWAGATAKTGDGCRAAAPGRLSRAFPWASDLQHGAANGMNWSHVGFLYSQGEASAEKVFCISILHFRHNSCFYQSAARCDSCKADASQKLHPQSAERPDCRLLAGEK